MLVGIFDSENSVKEVKEFFSNLLLTVTIFFRNQSKDMNILIAQQ